MVCDCQNCVIPCDKVHSNGLEWKWVFRGDRDHGRFEGSGVDFTFLASGATPDILFDVLFHVGPPKVLLSQGIGICNSWMSGGQIVMEKLIYPSLQIIVTSNNGLCPLPPVSIFV